MKRIVATSGVLLLLVYTGAGGVGAQQPGGSVGVGLQATRTDLEELVRHLEETAQAPDSSDGARARAGVAARAVQARLTEGDFLPGDRIVIRVEADPPEADRTVPQGREKDPSLSVEQQLSDTFTVRATKIITLPVLGAVSLRGVLRSELETYLTQEISRYIRDPVVHARPLIRLAIIGGVAHPGFYSLPADAVFADAVMAAGGATQDAKMDKVRIERAGKRWLDGRALQQAMTEGRTLDEMNLQAGDRFIVPERSHGTAEDAVRIVAIVLGIPVTVYTLTKIF
jgi:protein involved in polysaccharide export with SLBB domain